MTANNLLLISSRDINDIIFIQETHWTDNKQLVIQQNWNGDVIVNHGTVNACGVAILIHARQDFQLQQIKRDSHGRILALKITIDDSVINLVMSMPLVWTQIADHFSNSWKTSYPVNMTIFLEEILILFLTRDLTNLGETQTLDSLRTKYY